jgi:2-dehydro-3-deoxygalactonokinase
VKLAEGFVAVDWGTTNRRIFVVGGDGVILDRIADDYGVSSLVASQFEKEIGQLRGRYKTPIMLAGMIGSKRGWIEAPYVRCPADLTAVANAVVRPERDIAIVPGVSYCDNGRVDVMRGEEIQLLGAAYGDMMCPDAIVCHPGTHAKWAVVRNGAIHSFRTIMTGEIFALLRRHSMLSDFLQFPVELGGTFEAGVRHALDHDDLLASLFSVRAKSLLGLLAPEEAVSFISGLLVGSDTKIGLDDADPEVSITLIGDSNLMVLYGAALAVAGRQFSRIDGERAFVAGARFIAEKLT